MNTQDPKYQQKSKAISSAEVNYLSQFEMRYPVVRQGNNDSLALEFWKIEVNMASEIFRTLSSFCTLGVQKLKKHFMWKAEMISPNYSSLECTICVPVIAISCKSNQSFIKLSMYIKHSIQPFFLLQDKATKYK